MPGFYENSWDRIVSDSTSDAIHERTGYSEQEQIQAHLEIFMPYMEGESVGDQHQAWVDYLDLMVESGHTQQEREEFMRDVLGIDPADFDWNAWREAMGY